MSRAFVKESDGEREPAIEAPRREHPYYVTPEGLAKLRSALDVAVRESNLRDAELFRRRIAEAVVVDMARRPKGRVDFGATLTVELPGGDRQTYRIVGEDEADPLRGSISWLSPLAQAVWGRPAGARAVWQRPAGNVSIRIVSVEYP